jgi:hypothetical protein
MAVTREQVLNAIFSEIQSMTFGSPINTQTTWLTTGRRLKLWGDVQGDSQPAAFLVEHEEHDEYRNLGLDRRRLNARVWCYARTDDPTIVGGTLLNTMLEAFDAKFGMEGVNDWSRNANTLGGLVYFCRLEGRVFKDPGDIDNQAVLIVPLIVELP